MQEHLDRLKKMYEHLDRNQEQDLVRLNGYLAHHIALANEANTTPLEISLKLSKVDQDTLDAMMESLENFRDQMHRFSLKRSALQGRTRIVEWDVNPPPPKRLTKANFVLSENELIETVASAFNEISTEWSETIREIHRRGLLNLNSDTNVCRTVAGEEYPRLEIDFKNDWRSLFTLSHEMGHAFHCRTLEKGKNFAFGLAEFCSIFAESYLREKMLTVDPQRALETLWYQISVPDLICAPLGFEIERALFEMKKQGPITLKQVETVETEYVKKWFKIRELDQRPSSWQKNQMNNKVSFYNYPFAIGYLLSIKTLESFKRSPQTFSPLFKTMLKDTSECTIKEFVKKHWNQDSSQVDFWNSCLHHTQEMIEKFVSLEDK
jgi:oligoendopeptidase F